MRRFCRWRQKARFRRLQIRLKAINSRFRARPAFMSNGRNHRAERGTATHRVMEFIDFNKSNELDAELERLYEWQYLSEREYNAVPRDKIKAFFESDIFAQPKKIPLG